MYAPASLPSLSQNDVVRVISEQARASPAKKEAGSPDRRIDGRHGRVGAGQAATYPGLGSCPKGVYCTKTRQALT
jgi:hypothetical protein